MSDFRDSYIQLNDKRKLSFKSYGEKNENIVLFLHGFGSSASAIHPDPSILDKYNVQFYSINRPGYGDSDLKMDFSMEDVADDINEFLEIKGIKNVSVIGWSAGGLYSQVFADKYFNRVESLNLVSSAIPLNSKETKKILPSNWKLIANLNRYIPFMTKIFFHRLSKELVKNIDATLQKSINEMVEEDQRVARDLKFQDVMSRGALESYHNRGLAVYCDARALCKKTALNRNTQPFNVNIWQGGKDQIWPEETSEFLKKIYPKSKYTLIKDEGHLLYLSYWDEIIKNTIK